MNGSYNNLNTSIVAKPKRKKLVGIGQVQLKWLRFRCYDVDKTVDFYESIGMSLDYKKKKEYSDDCTLAFIYKNVILSEKDECDNVQLVFDYSSLYVPTLSNLEYDYKNDKKRLSEEYLLIYVHFIERLIKRVDARGIKYYIPLQESNGIKYIIYKDPNGIEVRLMEYPSQFLNENLLPVQWFSKLGYYTLSIPQAGIISEYLQNIFSVEQKSRNKYLTPAQEAVAAITASLIRRGGKSSNISQENKSKEKRKDNLFNETMNENDIFLPSENNNNNRMNIRGTGRSENAKIKRKGFKILDYEDITFGLTRQQYYWLGDKDRNRKCTLCLIQKTQEYQPNNSVTRDKFNLVAIGFKVPNLDTAIKQLKKDFDDIVDNERVEPFQKGGYIRFNNILKIVGIELYSLNYISNKLRKLRKIKNELGNKPVFREYRPYQDNAINMNHLKGMARSFSEGALVPTKYITADHVRYQTSG
ncbi:hypothetical protein BCR32DRAFT_297903 [Anaeromyces robustus]|uniref:Uncharacterized protein n=1 Tax=Anaeromyces robustus TaxID=1754192 RepID=A0A1Y1VUB0_9FUNG|nr:hypothetical protein BCR32DRAFT_297903 [Anaeromyces robustus]|eukprot:ORX64872.1 hypothetical protein BCR32DRAFT_297903 [Anaeromyces robustus]